MATKTLRTNVNQAVQDFDNIKQAIIDKGVEIPNGTPTSEYATKIGDIQGGGGGIDTSEVTDFSNFCANNKFPQEEVNKIKTPNGTNFTSMFSSCTNLTSIPQLDTSKGTSFDYMFQNCKKLTSSINLDTSKGTYFGNMFESCYLLETLELTSFISSSNMFYNCSALENLTVTGTITVNNNYLNLSSSSKLTVESLM